MTPRKRPRRRLSLALLGLGLLGVALWAALSGPRRAAAGAPCGSPAACRSGICLPDSDPAEVASFIELGEAYELGRRANPVLVGEIDELLERLPRSSLSLRPRYPGVCTERCALDADCPPGLFCAEAIWTGLIRGLDVGRVRVCVPDGHPAARLMR